jgi:hypothetical protein
VAKLSAKLFDDRHVGLEEFQKLIICHVLALSQHKQLDLQVMESFHIVGDFLELVCNALYRVFK